MANMATKKELHEIVKANLLKNELRNHRTDFDIKQGSLIVLGYDYRNNDSICGDKVYVFIAEYVSGDLNSVYTKNELLLEHIGNHGKQCDDVLTTTHDENCADAMDWWRIPTDDEVELYNKYYKHHSIIKEINKFIDDIDYNNMDDVIELLEWIKIELTKNEK